MKKCCFIIPYFGKMPSYFELFLKSCEKNPDYDWLIFSNDQEKYNLPSNVSFIHITFEELHKMINDKMNMECVISEVHKLCDYKPAYGLIFEDYLKKYEFWGHCDLDIILGNLNDFITEEMLNTYDKIFCLGHMILYKNDYDINRLFMKPVDGNLLYKKVFSTDKTLIFDETFGGKENIDTIFRTYNKKVYSDDVSFNVKIFPSKFIRTKFDYETYSFNNEKYVDALYLWDDGKIKRIFVSESKLKEEEFAYIHLQQRNMKFKKEVLKLSCFKIIPNEFQKCEFNEITIENFKKIKRRNIICLHSIATQIKWKRKGLKKRLKKYVRI
jgi:hypothetical protein